MIIAFLSSDRSRNDFINFRLGSHVDTAGRLVKNKTSGALHIHLPTNTFVDCRLKFGDVLFVEEHLMRSSLRCSSQSPPPHVP